MKKSFFFAFCLSYLLTYFPAFADLDTLWVRKQHTSGITDLWFSPKSDTLKSVAADGQVITWKAATGEVLHKWQLPIAIKSGVFSPNGKFLATISGGFTAQDVKVWSLEQESLFASYSASGLPSPYSSRVCFSPGSDVIAVSDGLNVWLFDVVTKEVKKQMNVMAWITGFSPDGQNMVGIGDNVVVIDTGSMSVIHSYTGRDIPTYSPNGKYVAMSRKNTSTEYWAEIYDAKTGMFVNKVVHNDQIYGVTFTPGGRFLISSSYAQWNVTEIGTSTLLFSYNWLPGIEHFLISSDSAYIVVGGSKGEVLVMPGHWFPVSVHDQGNSGEQNILYSIAPNPIMDNICTIRFHLSNTNTYPVTIIITDTLGRSIPVAQNQNYQSGDQTITFDISNLANGSYTCTMQIDGHSYSQSFTITR